MVADARERAVIPFIEDAFPHAFIVKQVTTADYLVCFVPTHGEAVVLAAIERKTLADFSASFKDGRHHNVERMKALRAATGCKLFYFVEGPAFHATTTKFGGIPFACILAAMTRMMVCDDIFVVQTESAEHSAKRLADFVGAFDSGPRVHDADGPALAVPGILTVRQEETDGEAAACVWARLPGISAMTGRLLTRAFSVADLAAQTVTPEQVVALTTATGRPINKEAVESLMGVRAGSNAALLVSGIKGITPAVASILLDAMGCLARLCTDPLLAGVRVPQKTRSIHFGKPRAERVQRILGYKLL